MTAPKPGHVRVFVAAGSNVEPEKNLARACAEIAHTWPDAHFSRAYRNVAVGFEGPDFINLVIGFSAAQPLQSVIENFVLSEERIQVVRIDQVRADRRGEWG